MKRPSLRKKRLVPVLLLWAVFASAVEGRAADEARKKGPGLEFKVGGLVGFFPSGGGDLETYRQGMIDLYTDIGTIPGFNGNQGWNKLGSAAGVSFDAIFRINERIGVGVGTGWIRASSGGNYGFTYGQAGSESWGTYTLSGLEVNGEDFKISTIPLRFSLYLTFPAGRWNFYGYAGAGYYWGTLTRRYTYDFSYNYADSSPLYPDEKTEISSSESRDESAKAGGLGIHGGLGVEYRVLSFLAFGLEVYGRHANLSGWEGDAQWTATTRERQWREDAGWTSDQSSTDTGSKTGKLWFYETGDEDLGQFYPRLDMRGAPVGGNFRNVRSAALNLSAYGLAVTLKVFFDL